MSVLGDPHLSLKCTLDILWPAPKGETYITARQATRAVAFVLSRVQGPIRAETADALCRRFRDIACATAAENVDAFLSAHPIAWHAMDWTHVHNVLTLAGARASIVRRAKSREPRGVILDCPNWPEWNANVEDRIGSPRSGVPSIAPDERVVSR